MRKAKYTASMKIMGKVYTAIGGSVSEAVGNLKPDIKKGVAVLTVSKGKESKSRIITPPQVFRLFTASRLMREIALKNVSLLFDL